MQAHMTHQAPNCKQHRTVGYRRALDSQCRRRVVAQAQSANQSTPTKPAVFPASYDQAIRQAQESVKAAIADGHKLIEVEFPPTTLDGVSGDSDGGSEMNSTMGYMRQFLGAFRDQASSVRIFWPDRQEAAVAQSGQTMDPAAGRAALEPVFEDVPYQMGWLTEQNAIWATLGVNIGFGGKKFSPVQQVRDTDKMYLIAYPCFNPREELSAVYELHSEVAGPRDIPVVVFNGELDRLRGGYYVGFAFQELAKLTKDFLPKFTQAYYIHNFKGTRPGALFRAYPGPWCVYRRNPLTDDMKLIWTSDTMPTLKQVALEILPSNL